MNAIEEAAIAAVPGGSGLKVAIKAAPFVLIALLIMGVLWLRNEVTDANARADAATVVAASLQSINDENAKQIEMLSKQRIDNDKIARDLASKVEANRRQREDADNAIRKAIDNEPGVRNWANQPVPDSLRRALAPKPDEVPSH